MDSPMFSVEIFTEQPSLVVMSTYGPHWDRATRGWSVRNAASHEHAIKCVAAGHPFGSRHSFLDGVEGVLVKFECRRVPNVGCGDHCVVAHYDIIESEVSANADCQKTE